MTRRLSRMLALTALASSTLASAQTATDWKQARERARTVVSQMTPDEKVLMTHGIMPLPHEPNGDPPPPGAPMGAGYVPGIPRLGVPALTETDAAMGVSWIYGARKDFATGLPSGMAMGATWNPELLHRAGAMIGSEARAKGFNVLLAGSANMVREPRNGRTFEYLSEDPLLTGALAGASIAGIQSNHILSTVKHFAFNGQETGRSFATMTLSEAAGRESDLLAFQIAIERGQPGAVMCAYNKLTDGRACDSPWLLTDVLKHDWSYPGFVMSDWGAVPRLEAALSGLDQQSAARLDAEVFLGGPLKEKARTDPAYAARLDDMNERILASIFVHGLDRHPVAMDGAIDFAANGRIAQEVAEQGSVLLRNQRGMLPLAAAAKSIAIIGGYADSGVLTGAGSSEVQAEGGPALIRPFGGEGLATVYGQNYQRSVPLKAIRALAPKAEIRFRDGRYISEAVAAARRSEIAIVFATQWASEGIDVPDLTLPDGQDALIAAVADANPNTIVVLETGGPVLMPWNDKVGAILAAWYPGTRGAEAIASILFGTVNPSGRLPVSFPASERQLPRPVLDGKAELETDWYGREPYPGAVLKVDYDIEGADVGYRWYAREKISPLYAFGHGLSYTRFETSPPIIRGDKATVSVRNVGSRAGATVAQLYATTRNGTERRRLAGFTRISLQPGETKSVTLDIEPRVIADWTPQGWVIPAGTVSFAMGDDAMDLGPSVNVRYAARRWRDGSRSR